MPNSSKVCRMLGGVGVEVIAYDVFCVLSIVSILVALSKTRLKRVLEEDALSRRLVTMCGLSLVYEYKFRLGQQISHFRFMREYAYTLVGISQLAHFVALIAAAVDAICWRVSSRRARLCLRPKAARFASWMAWTLVTFSSVAVVGYVQLYRGENAKILVPKQVAELASIPLTLLFFVVTVFWRPAAATDDKTEYRADPATEAISYVYIRMMVVTFAVNCSRIILIMVKTEWKFVRFIHALDGCFFALIAYKLEPPDVDVDVDVLSETFVDQRQPDNSDSTAGSRQV